MELKKNSGTLKPHLMKAVAAAFVRTVLPVIQKIRAPEKHFLIEKR
ncbi:MAG: hypothetical protein WCB68_05795 [Pyrinomonadaceae bacterium]